MSYGIMKKILSVLAIILLIIFLSIHAKAKEGYDMSGVASMANMYILN